MSARIAHAAAFAGWRRPPVGPWPPTTEGGTLMSFGDGGDAGGFDAGQGADYGGGYDDGGLDWLADVSGGDVVDYSSGMEAGIAQGAQIPQVVQQALAPVMEAVSNMQADR